MRILEPEYRIQKKTITIEPIAKVSKIPSPLAGEG
jgi:hypothetical protein